MRDAEAMSLSAGAPSKIVEPMPALLHFPTSVGILLAISTCAHLASLANALVGEGLVAALWLGVGQFALSLSLLRLYNGVWVFQDIRVTLVIFMFLYGFTLPAVALAQGSAVPGLTEAAVLYGTSFLGFNLVQWWYRQPWRDVTAESLAGPRPTFASAVVVLLGFVALVSYAWFQGTRSFLTFDRSQMGWLFTQTWIVTIMLINGCVMYMFAGWPRLSPGARRILAATIAAFVIFQLGLGNRHAFLPMFIFLAGMVASRRRAVTGFRTVAITFFLFVIFMLVGIFRQVRSTPWVALSPASIGLIAQYNEFTMPIQTITYYTTVDNPLRYGLTYLMAPSAFMPRLLWPEKPVSLSVQFSRQQFGNIMTTGYAYTPITEAYVNFGFVGPFIIMSLVSLGTVFLVKGARQRPILYFLCFSLVIDFSRGDASGFLYSLVVFGLAFGLMKLVSRIEWVPGSFQSMWPPVVRAESPSGP